MTSRSDPKPGRKKLKVKGLKLNKETVQDLTETEAEAAAGGYVVSCPAGTICGPSQTCATHCGQLTCGCPVVGKTGACVNKP